MAEDENGIVIYVPVYDLRILDLESNQLVNAQISKHIVRFFDSWQETPHGRGIMGVTQHELIPGRLWCVAAENPRGTCVGVEPHA